MMNFGSIPLRNKALFFCNALFFFAYSVSAQIPNAYYNSAFGKKEKVLKTALYDIVKDHNSLSYGDLWSAFADTDKKSNGKVWDMYSDIPDATPPYQYTFFDNQCGNYKNEGDCYNREHSFPKSWFNDGYPMYTDLFHLYPTDGKVNGERGNYPFGEVNSPAWTSRNGSKRGSNSTSGYNKTVFEPINAYKGDFARSYFYMVTRYENVITTWTSSEAKETLAGNTYPAFKQWAIDLLLKWHRQDPVSQKETDRNNAVYQYQHNRNPYIDYPQLAEYVWGDSITYAFNPDKPTAIEMIALELEPVVYSLFGAIYVENITTASTIRIYNTVGQLIHRTQISKENYICDFPKNQFYIVQISDIQGNIKTIKVINH
ncbi:MAG: endonuclease [Candidatus Symbiothrix sp.]|jgi:endonuclease I|nr:endonuclease [Candidatus Symbiothrix sp.]